VKFLQVVSDKTKGRIDRAKGEFPVLRCIIAVVFYVN